LEFASKTDVGLVRPVNEDSVLADESLGLVIVADGLGGHNAGDVASRIAVETITSHVRQHTCDTRESEQFLTKAIREANGAIFARAASHVEWSEMGTTVVVGFFRDHRCTIAHVGDSRAYLISSGNMTQVTEDHTFVAEWLRNGNLTPEEARRHPARHGLTMALGITEGVDPETVTIPLKDGDLMLFCTDGLTDMVEEGKIRQIVLNAPDIRAACATLVASANMRGGLDNITAVLVKI
jgi:protein phosphatase